MATILRFLKSLLGFGAKGEIPDRSIDELLRPNFERLRNIDPETSKQWSHLHYALGRRQSRSRSKESRLIPRLVFGVIAVAVSAGIYIYFTSLQVSPELYATGKGEQKKIVLSDGSDVTLSYASELVVPVTRSSTRRNVSLSGEAYFRVQPSENPFVISTMYGVVQVVGTEFNVRARREALEIAVIEGSVEVSAVRDGRDSSLLVTRHQLVLVLPNDFPRRTGMIPSNEYPGWLHGKLYLDKTSLPAAVQEIEMRFNVSIVMANRIYPSDLMTGVLDAKSPESAVRALCELTGRRYTRESQGFTIH